jgi:hypothetical protein
MDINESVKPKKRESMKTKYRLFLMICLAGLLSSCQKDEINYGDVPDRERMAMFHWRDTGFDLSAEQEVLAQRVSGPLRPNSMFLIWNGIKGAAGYHIRVRMSAMGGQLGGPDTWTQENVYRDVIISDPDSTHIVIPELQYGTSYRFAIRTLSPEGVFPTAQNLWTPEYENDPKHSAWYGYGDANQRDHCFFVDMYPREGLPEVITYDDRTETSVTVRFTIYWDDIITREPNFGLDPSNPNYIALNEFLEFDEASPKGKRFKLDYITLVPTVAQTSDGTVVESKRIDLTETDKDNGYVEFTGLTPNVQYIVNGVNANIMENGKEFNAYYNTEMVRMRGGIPPTVEIEHVLYTAIPRPIGSTDINFEYNETKLEEYSRKYDACRIDTILNTYMNDTDLPEGTEFLLEGGKTYWIHRQVDLSKGLKLRSADPNNPAKVYLGGNWTDIEGRYVVEYDITKINTLNAPNFSFGRTPRTGEMGSIVLEDIIMENIDFEVPNAFNYDNRTIMPGPPGTGQGNYFVNQNPNAMPFRAESFQLLNCTFQGFIRGFIRVQGSYRRLVNKILIDNCLLYNSGSFSGNNGGYAFIVNDATDQSNLYQEFTMTNSTILNAAYPNIMDDRKVGATSMPTFNWNVRIENCTFINLGTRAANSYLLNLQYPPKNSRITFKKNLLVICPPQGGTSAGYYFSGANIVRTAKDELMLDFSENYSTNIYANAGGAFFSSGRFDNIPLGATLNASGLTGLMLNEGFPSIAPGDLMIDPYPLGAQFTPNGNKHNLDGIYFQDTPTVRNHDIVTKAIGDPRWRSKLQ